MSDHRWGERSDGEISQGERSDGKRSQGERSDGKRSQGERSDGKISWPGPAGQLIYGCDYNPEQWPLEVQLEDIELMQRAGVNLVSLGIFAWATLEPSPGEFDFGWLDDVLDRLDAAGIKVALATATATPPPWLTRLHPEILPQTIDGTVLSQGSRQTYCASSPVMRREALRLTTMMAQRYGSHPAVALWHVDNELGAHAPHCYCDVSASAFRTWLTARYGTVEALNKAWGTAFWSQKYRSFDDVLPPRLAPTTTNPTQQLDFARFSSDELLSYYIQMRDALRAITPNIPTTTNLMATTFTRAMDYFTWTPELDVIANDHYLIPGADSEIELAFSADLTRGIAGSRPWMLMEHSTSAVNWRDVNRPKGPGEMLRNSLSHVARGADAVMFFQWRQSRAGSEKFHSAMVPHAGADSAVFRQVVELGAALDALRPIFGSTVRASVALVFDYQAWWAVELDSHPRNDLTYLDRVFAQYRTLWKLGVTVDIVSPASDLGGYTAIFVPTLYLVTDADAAAIAEAAISGAAVSISYFSGIVDEHDHARLGGYPGAFRELLGVRVEEFGPTHSAVALDDGGSADFWAEAVELVGAEAVSRYLDGPAAGLPAVTRRTVGAGSAWYLGCRLDDASLLNHTRAVLAEAGVFAEVPVVDGLEVVRRHGHDGSSFLFAINHGAVAVELSETGTELLTGKPFDGSVAGFGVAVIAQ